MRSYDRTTGSVLRSVPTPRPANTLALRYSDFSVYGHDATVNEVYRLDPCTGATGAAVAVPDELCGMAFTEDGRLLAVDRTADEFVEIDVETGAAVSVGSLPIGVGNCGMAYDCESGLGYVVDDENETLLVVDTSDLTTWSEGPIGIDLGGNVGLARDPVSGLLYVGAGHSLYTLDPDTLESNLVAEVEHLFNDLAIYDCP